MLGLAVLLQRHAGFSTILASGPPSPHAGSKPQPPLATVSTMATVAAPQTPGQPAVTGRLANAPITSTSVATAASSAAAPTPSAAGQPTSPPVPPLPSAAFTLPAALPTFLTDTKPSVTEMLFLIFHLDKGRLTLQQAVRTAGYMPLPAATPMVAGIYHRLVSANGTVLAQSVCVDPAIVYHDSPRADGSGLLEGGRVRLESVDFDVRYPALPGASRIELYQVDATTDVRSLDQRAKGFYGSFPLP